MNITKWSFENKQALRELYADFLEEANVSLEDFLDGNCVSYQDFQTHLYLDTNNEEG